MFRRLLKEYSLYLWVFLVPLFWLPFSFESWEFQKIFLLVFGGLGFVVWCVWRRLSSGSRDWKFLWPYDFLVLLFLFSAVVSSVFSVDRLASLFGFYGRFSDGLIGLMGFGIVYFLASRESRRGDSSADFLVSRRVFSERVGLAKERGFSLSDVLILSSLINLAVAFLSVFGVWQLLVRLSPVLSQRNFNLASPSFEGLSLFILPLFFLAWGLKGKKKLTLLFLGLAFLFLVDYNPAWLVLGLTALAFLLWQGLGRYLSSSLKLWPILFLVLAVVGLSFNFAGVLPSVWKGFPREATLDQTTSWQVSLDALRAKPLLGSGLGTFFYDFSRFRKPDFNQNSLWQVRFDRPVSHLAELLATTGFLGIFSYLLLVGFSLFGLLSLAFRKRETGYETLFFALLASCLAQVFYYQNAATGFVFWLLLGVTAGSVGREKTFSWPFCFKNRLARLVLVIKILGLSLFLLFAVFSGIRVWQADFYYSQALKKTKPEEKIIWLEKAVSANPYFAEYYIILSRSWLDSALAELAKPDTRDLTKIFHSLKLSVASVNRALILCPNWVAGWETLAMVYQEAQTQVSGSQDWAVKSFEKALELEPGNPLLYLRLGRLYWSKEELALARKYFLEARSLKPDLLEPKLYLALLREKEGDLAGASWQMSHLADQEPLNADVAFQSGRLYFNEGRNDQAIWQFKRALSINPYHLDSLYSLALVYEKKGEKAQAVSLLEKALEISPDNSVLKKKLAELQ